MIQMQTLVKVADNSGAKIAKCIKVLGGYKKKYAKIGDIIVISVQQLRNRSKLTTKVKKGDIYKALVIRTKIKYKKKDGSFTFYDTNFRNNAVVLMSKKKNPIGTRITEPIPAHLRKEKFTKFLSISRGII